MVEVRRRIIFGAREIITEVLGGQQINTAYGADNLTRARVSGAWCVKLCRIRKTAISYGAISPLRMPSSIVYARIKRCASPCHNPHWGANGSNEPRRWQPSSQHISESRRTTFVSRPSSHPGSRGCGRARGFLLKRRVSLYRQGDLRYDGTSQKVCRRGTSWPLPFIKAVRWPTCLWRWGSSAAQNRCAHRYLLPSTPRACPLVWPWRRSPAPGDSRWPSCPL